jgi:hypothetical protein
MECVPNEMVYMQFIGGRDWVCVSVVHRIFGLLSSHELSYDKCTKR